MGWARFDGFRRGCRKAKGPMLEKPRVLLAIVGSRPVTKSMMMTETPQKHNLPTRKENTFSLTEQITPEGKSTAAPSHQSFGGIGVLYCIYAIMYPPRNPILIMKVPTWPGFRQPACQRQRGGREAGKDKETREAQALQKHLCLGCNVGAFIILIRFGGFPCYKYTIIYTKTLF